MSILEKIKAKWLYLIVGLVIIIVLLFGNMLVFLENLFTIFIVFFLLGMLGWSIVSIFFINKDTFFKEGFLGVVLLGLLITYNPIVEDFEVYYKYEQNIPNDTKVSVNILRRNFVFFSLYNVKLPSTDTSTYRKTTDYIGVLGNFGKGRTLPIVNHLYYNIEKELDELLDDPKYYISEFIGYYK